MDIERRRGQAMVEVAVCMFFIALVVSALLNLAPIILAQLDLQGELRAEAGNKALNNAVGTYPSYIGGWDEGSDGVPFTGDDKARGGTGIASAQEISNASVTDPEQWTYPRQNTQLVGTMYDLSNIAVLPVSFAEASDSETVEVEPFAADYLFKDETIKLKYKVMMPMSGGLL